MRKNMATKKSPAELALIQSMRASGRTITLADTHPITDAIAGGIVIAAVIGWFILLWIKQGAGIA